METSCWSQKSPRSCCIYDSSLVSGLGLCIPACWIRGTFLTMFETCLHRSMFSPPGVQSSTALSCRAVAAIRELQNRSHFGQLRVHLSCCQEVFFANWGPPCRVLVENVSEWFSIFFLIYRCWQHHWDVNRTSLVKAGKNMVDNISSRKKLA